MLQQFNIISLGNSAINKVGLLSVGRIQQVFAGPGTGSTLIYLNPLKQTDNFVKITVAQTPGQVAALIAGSSAGAKAVVTFNNGTQNQISILTVDNIAWAFSTGATTCEFYYESQLTIPLQRLTSALSLADFQTLVNGTNGGSSTAYNFDNLSNGRLIDEGGTIGVGEQELVDFSILVDRFSCASEIIVELTDVSGYFGGNQTTTIPVNSSAAKFGLTADAVIPDGTYEVIVTTIGCTTQAKSYYFQVGSGSGSGSGSGGGGGSLTLFPTSPFSMIGTITQNSATVWTVDPTTTINATTNEIGVVAITGGKWTIQADAVPNQYTVAYVPSPSTALINGILPVVSSSIIVASVAPPTLAMFAGGTVVSGTISF